MRSRRRKLSLPEKVFIIRTYYWYHGHCEQVQHDFQKEFNEENADLSQSKVESLIKHFEKSGAVPREVFLDRVDTGEEQVDTKDVVKLKVEVKSESSGQPERYVEVKMEGDWTGTETEGEEVEYDMIEEEVYEGVSEDQENQEKMEAEEESEDDQDDDEEEEDDDDEDQEAEEDEASDEEPSTRTDQPSESFPCTLCPKVFRKKCSRQQHYLRKHKNEGLFKCSICGKPMKTEISKRNHESTHKSEFEKKHFVCHYCGKEHGSEKPLRYHIRVQHENYIPVKFPCKFKGCGKKLQSKGNLALHMKTHTRTTLIKCKMCPKTFKYIGSYKRHKSFHDRELRGDQEEVDDDTTDGEVDGPVAPGRTYHCVPCDKRFKSSHRLSHHNKKRHLKDTPFKCVICAKPLATSLGKRIHESTHKSEYEKKHFVCHYCGKEHGSDKPLRVHIRVEHENGIKKTHVCEICGKAFAGAAHLRAHNITHTGARPYKCELCQKGLTTKSSYVRHMNVHAGIFKFKCIYCEKTFADGSTRKVHYRQHTGEEPYSCEFCGKTFKQAQNMRSHIRHIHRKDAIME